ncbi:neuropilin-2-like [Amphiura filiformis]|uniref:neuropilin-2-like n=1 Tax=Amphiura filiformis TaxID=82378 RepID=UPI003B20EC56
MCVTGYLYFSTVTTYDPIEAITDKSGLDPADYIGIPPAACDKTFTETPGVFTSPYYPSRYTHLTTYVTDDPTIPAPDKPIITPGDYTGPPPLVPKAMGCCVIVYGMIWDSSSQGQPAKLQQFLHRDIRGIQLSLYPDKYPLNLVCQTLIQAPAGNTVVLDILDFAIEKDGGLIGACGRDWDTLSVYDGSDSSAPLLGKYCGRLMLRTVVSTGINMLVVFKSDYIIARRGFEAAISFTASSTSLISTQPLITDGVRQSPTTTVGGSTRFVTTAPCVPRFPTKTVIAADAYTGSAPTACDQSLIETQGTISSPMFPSFYPVNLLCKISIRATVSSVVVLDILDFYIECDGTTEGDCSRDYDTITIWAGPDASWPLLARYCGVFIPPRIVSSYRFMYIEFKSDYDKTQLGFRISVNFAPGPCNIAAFGMESGKITDSQITESSFTTISTNVDVEFTPARARLNGEYFWAEATATPSSPWIMVDFYTFVIITGIISQGSNRGGVDYCVEQVIFETGTDVNALDFIYLADGVTLFIADANNVSVTEVTISLPISVTTQYLRITPHRCCGRCAMKFEVLGCTSISACSQPSALGMEDGSILDSQITASSFWLVTESTMLDMTGKWARLNGPFAWHTSVNYPTEPWVAVDLTLIVLLTGIKMQGSAYDTNYWISKVIIEWKKYESELWTRFVYKQRGDPPVIYDCNTDASSTVDVPMPQAVTARYVKIVPQDWHLWCACRFEVMACY